MGLQVPHPGLPRVAPRRRASPTTCMPSTSCATGPAPRPSCADPASSTGRDTGPSSLRRSTQPILRVARRRLVVDGTGLVASAFGLWPRLRADRPLGRLLADRGDRVLGHRLRRREPVRRGRDGRGRVRLAGDRASSTGLVNARHFLYSAAMAPWLRGQPFLTRVRDGPRPDRRGVCPGQRPLPAAGPGRPGGLLAGRDRVDVHPLEPGHDPGGPGRPVHPGPAGAGDRHRLPGRDGRSRGRAGQRPARGGRGGRRRRSAQSSIGLAWDSRLGVVVGGLVGPLVGLAIPVERATMVRRSSFAADAHEDGLPS